MIATYSYIERGVSCHEGMMSPVSFDAYYAHMPTSKRHPVGIDMDILGTRTYISYSTTLSLTYRLWIAAKVYLHRATMMAM